VPSGSARARAVAGFDRGNDPIDYWQDFVAIPETCLSARACGWTAGRRSALPTTTPTRQILSDAVSQAGTLLNSW